MSLLSETTENGTVLVIKVTEDFTFNSNYEFKNIIQSNKENIKKFTVDFKNTKYIDSHGLGMLINLKELAKKNNANIEVCNISGQVKEAIELSNFDKIFNVK